MSDFLLELRSEEIPARMQAGARASLEKLFREQISAAGVTFGTLTIWSTPRRLALIAREMPMATAAVSEELKGPKLGAPPQALEGFLRKTGLTEDQLTQRDGAYFAIFEKPGRATAEVLAEAIPAIIRAFPWPKSQRWGAASLSPESLRWVRPLSGIVALLGDDLVECEVGGVASDFTTIGHRFHHSGEITIGNAADYPTKLRAAHVIVDHAEREAIIRTGAAKAAADAGLVLVEDQGLVIENAGLTEWPVPLLGRFDKAFLEVPPEVIQLTARSNQKYFVCEERGKLANAFVCTANIAAADGGAGVVDGNRKVLAARLSDARFFWEQDRKKPLAVHAEKLANIVFHEKLGTVADKVERVAKLARWLVEEGIVTPSPLLFRGGAGGGAHPQGAALGDTPHPNPSPEEEGLNRARLANLAEQAARLCKADLTTEMVGEFPELQGLMGGYYARAEGLDPQVADAIRDHYKPVGQGDEVPTAPVTVAVSLADKLDSLATFFLFSMSPTGSRDPFALRRAALAGIATTLSNDLRFSLKSAINEAILIFWKQLTADARRATDWTDAKMDEIGATLEEEFLLETGRISFPQPSDFELTSMKNLNLPRRKDDNLLYIDGPALRCQELIDFFADRLKIQQREAGVRHDLIDAVFAAKNKDGGGEDDLVRLLDRVHALQTFVTTPDGNNLLAGYKRAANILKKEGFDASSPSPHGGEGRGVWVPMSQEGAHPHPTLPNGEGSRGQEGDFSLPYTPEPAEQALIDALATARPEVSAAVQAEDFTAAMAALASLRAPIDEFFENVTVNDAVPAKRTARLGLLAAFRDAVHSVADFSKIEG